MSFGSWFWVLYAFGVLLVSGVVGLHLGRFRQAYTEMTGMMAGMTMGMLNGFLLGYASAAATNSMFWGNLFGVLLGLSYGAYFGRAGGLMGVMDGAMGGVMGGSMGAMLALMMVFPREALLWTALLFALIYVAGMVGLVVLIEQSSPRHAALHRLLPLFTRIIAREVEEVVEAIEPLPPAHSPQPLATGKVQATSRNPARDPMTVGLTVSTKSGARETRTMRKNNQGNVPESKSLTYRRGGSVVPGKGRALARNSNRGGAEHEMPVSWMGGLAAIFIVVLLIVWCLISGGGAIGMQGSPSGHSVGQNGGNPTNLIPGYASNPHNLTAEFVRSLESRAVTVPVGPDGRQTVDMLVNGDTMSYEPSVIRVKAGVPVHLNLGTKGRDPG